MEELVLGKGFIQIVHFHMSWFNKLTLDVVQN